ncbi:MAG: alpha/beta fold hydrolase [Pseudomonadota bacterium]
MVSRFATPDGLSLAYADEGPRDGLPILCLAGLTRNMADFEDFAARYSREHRVIRLDARGRGESDRASDPMTYDIPHEAADAVALLDHLRVDRAVFVGTSRGGLLTMAIAATAPQRIRAAVLNDVGPEIAPEGIARIMGYVGQPPTGGTLDELAAAMQAGDGGAAPTLTRADWRRIAGRVAEETPDGLRWRYDPRLREALAAQAQALQEAQAAGAPGPDLWPMFEALAGRPVLVLRGANSDLLSPGTLAKMQERLPEMVAVTVPDRGHVPLLDEPEAAAAIDALLARAAES